MAVNTEKVIYIEVSGRRGPQGAKGDTGESGTSATIQVGTVTTLPAGSSATVENVGTRSAAVFDFGIPKGDTLDLPEEVRADIARAETARDEAEAAQAATEEIASTSHFPFGRFFIDTETMELKLTYYGITTAGEGLSLNSNGHLILTTV